jgi:hypothetical protein
VRHVRAPSASERIPFFMRPIGWSPGPVEGDRARQCALNVPRTAHCLVWARIICHGLLSLTLCYRRDELYFVRVPVLQLARRPLLCIRVCKSKAHLEKALYFFQKKFAKFCQASLSHHQSTVCFTICLCVSPDLDGNQVSMGPLTPTSAALKTSQKARLACEVSPGYLK